MIEIEQNDFPMENETESYSTMWWIFFLFAGVALLLTIQSNYCSNNKI